MDVLPEQSETPRQKVLNCLDREPKSALELSGLVGLSEKEVYDQLEQLLKSSKNRKTIGVMPAICTQCGFRFVKRAKLQKPGRCPQCKERRIAAALFHRK